MKGIIKYDPIAEVDGPYPGLIMVDKIVRISQGPAAHYRVIHLGNGTTVFTRESMEALSRKIGDAS